jgi:hypothetical protein
VPEIDVAQRVPRELSAASEAAPTASARRCLYHVAPRQSRASIEQYGLDSSRERLPGLAGTYLWEKIEQASAYAAPLGDDIWIVECTGIPLEFGGPCSIVPGERWTLDPIPCERLRGRHAVADIRTSATPSEGLLTAI